MFQQWENEKKQKNDQFTSYYLQNPSQRSPSNPHADRISSEPVYSSKSQKLEGHSSYMFTNPSSSNSIQPVQTPLHSYESPIVTSTTPSNPFLERSLQSRPVATRTSHSELQGGDKMESGSSLRNQSFLSPFFRDQDMVNYWQQQQNQQAYVEPWKPADSRSTHYTQKQTFSEGANMIWNRNELLLQQNPQTPYIDRMMMKQTRS